MDTRWRPYDLDSLRDVKILLHPTASMEQILVGVDLPSYDGVDLTPFFSQGSHTQFDCSLTLAWNNELFGLTQPQPNHIVEIQLLQDGEYKPVWMGIIDAINSITISRGERLMTLIAKTAETQDIWKTTKRMTELFPKLTDLAIIVRKVAQFILPDESIIIPSSSFSTPHSNTQLADMSAWEMITDICLPMGLTPFIDGLGRLRVARRDLQTAIPDRTLTYDRVMRIVANRQRPPANRVRIKWLNPLLQKTQQQGRKLQDVTLTAGWFMPIIWKTVWFSDDRSQKAENTQLVTIHSANLIQPFCDEIWEQNDDNSGRLTLNNKVEFTFSALALAGTWFATHFFGGPILGDITINPLVGAGWTEPGGKSFAMAAAQGAFLFMLMCVGTGVYEIWGTPFDFVHARNTTDAFDVNAPAWVNTATEIDTDFIVNEQHAQAVAVRELIYESRAANKWSIQIVDDPGIEMGDVLLLPDGNKFYVEDFTRPLTRGDQATLQVSGFQIGGNVIAATPVDVIQQVPVFPPVVPTGAPGPGPTPGIPGPPVPGPPPVPNPPIPGGNNPGDTPSNPLIAMPETVNNPDGLAAAVRRTCAHFGITTDQYWIEHTNHVGQISNKKYVEGWSHYWDLHADPKNTQGAADPATAALPSIY